MATAVEIQHPIYPIVVGTAGHVDHGKSSLVRALTGINPDRLKEEQERGLTIDIGFANFVHRDQFRVGLVDVPGHERFVKNMVTGATGVDLVILAVAANDGVMQQTREHLEILTLLGIKRGMIALTKVDLVDEEMIELVTEDVRDTLRGTFLENTAICPISVVTGKGMDEFRATLADMIDATPPHTARGAFRMPVQRVFSVKGHGAVLTGIPLSGAVAVGDAIETQPSGQNGKVRHIQAYHGDRERAQAGHSSAINVSGIDHHVVHRGHVAATPGYAHPVSSLIARVNLPAGAPRSIKQKQDIKLLIDNSEVVATPFVLEGDVRRIAPGASALCRFQLSEAIVAAAGDRFIMRAITPAETLGGGRVVSLSPETVTHKESERVAFFARKAEALDQPSELCALTCLEAGGRGCNEEELARELWLLPKELGELTAPLLEKGLLRRTATGRMIHRDAWSELSGRLLATLEEYHKANPQAAGMAVPELQQQCGVDPRVFGEVLDALVREGKASREGDVVIHHKYGAKLSDAQKAALDKMRGQIQSAGFSAPSLDELKALTGLPEKDFRAIVSFLTSRGEAVLIAATFLMHKDRVADAVERARQFVAANGPMRAADFRGLLDTSRKYAIPILEYLDAKGYFINKDGVRVMKP